MALFLYGMKTRRLTVIRKTNEKEGSSIKWICKCRCGNEVAVSGRALVPGKNKIPQQTCGSCNDWFKYPKEYSAWAGMKTRCYNKEERYYPDYGGRGIIVADVFLEDFLNFLDHIGPAPGPEYSVDRINNEGNYEPGNIRWATDKEQANNKRDSKNSLTQQDYLDIISSPHSVQFLAKKYNRAIQTIRNIKCKCYTPLLPVK